MAALLILVLVPLLIALALGAVLIGVAFRLTVLCAVGLVRLTEALWPRRAT